MEGDWIAVNRMEDVEETDKSNRKEMIYSWSYTPSGRYAADFDYKEIQQHNDQPDTHHFFLRFFVFDVLKREWRPYSSNTGPFKRFYSFYWLHDTCAILLDFTKRDSSVRQNVLNFDHVKKTVTCGIVRNIEFDVDFMCCSKDLTSQRIFHPRGELLLLCGHRSSENGLVCRLVPYVPFVDFFLTTDTFLIDTEHIIRSLTLNDRIRVGGHPFMFGTTLTFLLYSRNATKVFHYINYTLQIDISTVIDGSEISISEKHARLNTFLFPQNPQWIPTLNSIPNIYNTDRFVLLWKGHRHKRRRLRKTKLYVLDLKLNVMRLVHSSLLKSDFVCIHPSGSLHTFIQTKFGMKMLAVNLNFHLQALKSLCQNELIRSELQFTDYFLICASSAFSEHSEQYYCSSSLATKFN
ncbi:hypothetical protein RB195_000434 [Necator americanus]|uniref:Uncharacterized protein n=1 Tax=Necator americanus TaxID=51031 RepID=A0ABR1DAK1_NECAM